MNFMISWIAKQEAYVFKEISFDWFQLVFSFILIIYGVQSLSKSKFRNIAPFLFAIIGLQAWGIWSNHQTKNKEIFLVAHQTKNTILLHQNRNKLNVISSENSNLKSIVTNYKIATSIDSVTYNLVENSFKIGRKKLYIMDSLGVYPTQKPNYILLSQSPKINLERLLDSIHPQILIADGSNYKSYIERWKKTCEKRKLPFHYTGEKGAYYFAN